jgi:DNA (cytosine-5)-methyltransferase 1
MTLKLASLCSGYGGLDLAVESHFRNKGKEVETVWFAENDKKCSEVLAHHWGDVPNYGDVTAIDWNSVPLCDILVAGYPCQPFSHAGKRKINDERNIWEYIANGISTLRPEWVVLENVAGHLTLGGTSVTGSLASMGYDMRWGIVRASDTGSPHKRARWFCLAWNTKSRNGGRSKHSSLDQGNRSAKLGESDSEDSFTNSSRERHGERENNRGMGDSSSQVESEAQQQRSRQEPEHRVGETQTPTNSTSMGLKDVREVSGLEEEIREARTFHSFGPYEPAIRRWEQVLGRVAPDPTDELGVSPRFLEWMMGLPDGWVCDAGLESRTAELKMLGNGVVPMQGELALRLLDV